MCVTFVFFKQMTAYELRFSDWSSDVCSSDLVAGASTHRRQGHLTRLIDEQLAHMVGAGVAIATLVAAEWPIYGRFGYGPAMDACGYDVDARAARFLAPASGTTELVTPAELEPHLTAMHEIGRAHV